jgi:putative DNA primase/helicase
MAWVNFDDVLQQLVGFGLEVSGADLVVGARQRCRHKDGGREKRGWYQLYDLPKQDGSGSLIVGSYGAFWAAENIVFKVELPKAERKAMSADQWEALKARMAEDKKRAEAEAKRKNEAAALRAEIAWRKCSPTGGCGYLERKGIKAYGLRFSPSGNMVVPMLDAERRVHGLQVIYAEKKGGRDKDFWPAGLAKKGHFFLIGNPDRLVLVAEGYATAASLHEATGHPVVVAFDAGNLLPVAQAVHKKWKRARVLICADDDYRTEGNPGVTHANTAALAVDGSVLAPVFSDERPVDHKGPTDFNDLHQIEGLHVVAKQVADHLAGLGWAVSAALHGAGGALQGGGEKDNDPRPAAVAIMELDEIVDRFLPIDDGTGRVVFDRWTNKLVHKDQMLALLPAGVRGDDIKRHPIWSVRGAYYLDEIGFDPAGTDKEVRLNTWQGWPMRPAQGECSLMLELIFQQCSKEKSIASALFKWLLQWMAYPLQNPGAKMGSAVVMHGPQGTGKSMIFTGLAELYGYGTRRRNYAIVIDGQALHANFNLDWENKLFINAEEVVNAQDKWELKNQLKHLVTGQTIRVEGKHMNAVHNTNRVNISFLSNDLLPFPIEPDDRRHLVIYTPPPLEKAFFRSLREEWLGGGREAFYHYLMNDVDCSDFDHTRPPMTEAKRMLQRLSSSSEIRFLGDWALGDLNLPVCPALASDVYAAYVRWCRNNGEPRPRPSNVFHATVGHLGGGWEKKKCRIYPSETATQTEPKPLILPPPDAMQRAEMAHEEGSPVAAWLTASVAKFRRAIHGSDEGKSEWAA